MIQLELCRVENKGGSGRILFVDNSSSYLIQYDKDGILLEASSPKQPRTPFLKFFQCIELRMLDGVNINPVSGTGQFAWKEHATDKLFQLTYEESNLTIRVYYCKTGQTLYLKGFHSEEDGESHERNSST